MNVAVFLSRVAKRVFSLSKDVGRFEREIVAASGDAILEFAYGHEIAWEYFEHSNPWLAFANEVMTGDEFMKARHMSEEMLAKRLKKVFEGVKAPPTLVLGHTHEARKNAVGPNGKQCANYINSGSAGRFQNLIWGVEIDPDGTSTIVTWHNDSGPNKSPMKLCRHEWTPPGNSLAPSASPIPL